jgi:hypothetical protein
MDSRITHKRLPIFLILVVESKVNLHPTPKPISAV